MQAYSWFYDKENDLMSFGEGFSESELLKADLNTFEKFIVHVHPDDRMVIMSIFDHLAGR